MRRGESEDGRIFREVDRELGRPRRRQLILIRTVVLLAMLVVAVVAFAAYRVQS